ncbi:MAG: STM4015 family protein [Ardenticatenales bacterium]|nr:STM4015 family protein [Ardenticatenales bacterium]
MAISSHVSSFAGRSVAEFDPAQGIRDPQGTAYALRLEYGTNDTFADIFELLLQAPKADNLEALVIGVWAQDLYGREATSEFVVEALVAARERLPGLQALFIGDITYEESEISWIEQSNVGPLLEAYPLLEVFQVRGGNSLGFRFVEPERPVTHERLRELVVQSGGLDKSVLQSICEAHLPNLEHLELWLGTDDYGANSTVEDLAPILEGTRFPKLTYLGLRDSDIADEIAKALATAPILSRVQELDLSMGTMTDEGMLALFDGLIYTLLQTLDVSENFLSPELVKRLREIPFNVITTGQKEADDDWRYVSVGE